MELNSVRNIQIPQGIVNTISRNGNVLWRRGYLKTLTGLGKVSVTDGVAGRAETALFKGKSVVFNQLINPANIPATTTINGVTFTNNGNGTITVNGTATQTTQFLLGGSSRIPFPSGHKAMICGNPSGASSSTYDMLVTHSESLYVGSGTSFIANSDMYINIIVNPNVTVNNLVYKPMLVDLTMLSDSLVTDYTSFKSRYPLDYYAFDSGTLKSNNSKWKCIGENMWDEQWELGTINQSTGMNQNDSNTIRSKNFIPCLPNTTYYFHIGSNYLLGFWYDADKNFISSRFGATNTTVTSPSNARYVRFHTYNYGATYNNDISINIDSTDTAYHPYHNGGTVDLSSIILRSAGTVQDTHDAQTGETTRKIGVVDLGTLNYVRYQVGSNYIFYTNITDGKRVTDGQSANVVCANYTTIATQTSASSFVANGNKIISTNQGGITVMRIVVRDDTYTDAAAFKAAMSGVMLYYELATPTTETVAAQQITLQNGNNNIIQTEGDFNTELALTYYGTTE